MIRIRPVTRLLSVSVVAACLVAAGSLAGAAAAAPGNYRQPSVGCSNQSQVLSMSGTADAQYGYARQWVGVQFAFRNIDTGSAWAYTPWSTFQSTWTSAFDPFGDIPVPHPGTATRSFTVSRGHYQVYARYAWWSGSSWTDTTGWISSYGYGYDRYISGVDFPLTLNDSCPVGI
jgi:hypothetical protein